MARDMQHGDQDHGRAEMIHRQAVPQTTRHPNHKYTLLRSLRLSDAASSSKRYDTIPTLLRLVDRP